MSEHYGRIRATGELIGPYDTVEELERELAASAREADAEPYSYAAEELTRQLERGPANGEAFFRLRVSGEGSTKHLNITPADLRAIADLLA